MHPDPPATADGATAAWQFWIDRGGTFTDVIGRRPDGTLITLKLLSDNPEQYADAAIEGVRRLLGVRAGAELPVERIDAVKMGTTVGTNALLERKGEATVLFITRGFRDQLRIGYQNRPRLFAREIRLPAPLYSKVVEVDERVAADGTVLVPLDEAGLGRELERAIAEGYRACAIVFMHSFRFAAHEQRAAELAEKAGFAQISVSHSVSPLPRIVARGDTTVVDAYLSPVLRRHVDRVTRELADGARDVPLYFMKSNGGLVNARAFRGRDSILSGPAGGIVGMVRTALAAGFQKVIGFDMGGTSTDVSHFSGTKWSDCERDSDAMIAGVRVRVPMMAIHTIAAGGGSIVHFDGQRYRVGPASAGANPGPACYRRGGPLTLTDCNVLLGRLAPEFFPKVFGSAADEPLDRDVVVSKFRELASEVTRATGSPTTPEAVAEGFLKVSSATMANAIKFISVQRGYDVTEYTLASFGGAGGQHACLVADEIGIERIYVHPLAGVLSALGMGLSDVSSSRESSFQRPLGPDAVRQMHEELDRLGAAARAEVEAQGVSADRITLVRRAHLKYHGTDSTLSVEAGDERSMRQAFEAAYRRRFAFSMPERTITIESLSVEAIGATSDEHARGARAPDGHAEPAALVPMFVAGAWRRVPLYRREELGAAQRVAGPAIIAESNATTVIEPEWCARVTAHAELVLERMLSRRSTRTTESAIARPDPVLLEVFNNLFMSIAERMGVVLANTAYSVNIKERLDFSCALFDDVGNLIANAPHMPVHLGSMGESIRAVIRRNAGSLRPGDVYALNDPYDGGTHLPDVTVVMPVFRDDAEGPAFFVAARGHHADIGGSTPGSMPPRSRTIEEEGILIDNLKLVDAGRFREEELRRVLGAGRFPARNADQNIGDLRAQIAACERGRAEVLQMIEHFGYETVRAYMRHVQDNAEESVRRAISALRDGRFECALDNGARVVVSVRVDRVERSAVVDFSGTSGELEDNFNAPPAVVHAAVLYVFRTLVDDDIPMNAGCLRPISVIVPERSMLAPRYPRATVAGNVETSQCIVDALYGALGTMGASQGTMNNFTFGDARYQYYETVAGGSGAGDGFHGAAAVQTHMTNSRMTDPEVIEARFPVLVEEHSIRAGSGGRGRFRGGDGALRRIRFLEPLTAAILSGRRLVPPYGMAGGEPGEAGKTWVERRDGSVTVLASTDEVTMNPGDVFVIATPSGGGYGPPS